MSTNQPRRKKTQEKGKRKKGRRNKKREKGGTRKEEKNRPDKGKVVLRDPYDTAKHH